MADYSNYHVSVPAKVAGTSMAADIQTAADAYNAAVDAGGPRSAAAIEASRAYMVELRKGLAEAGIDIAEVEQLRTP